MTAQIKIFYETKQDLNQVMNILSGINPTFKVVSHPISLLYKSDINRVNNYCLYIVIPGDIDLFINNINRDDIKQLPRHLLYISRGQLKKKQRDLLYSYVDLVSHIKDKEEIVAYIHVLTKGYDAARLNEASSEITLSEQSLKFKYMESEKKSQRRHNLLLGFLESATDAFILIDNKLRIMEMNKVALKYLPNKKEHIALREKPLLEIFKYIEKDSSLYRKIIELKNKGKHFEEKEFQIRKKLKIEKIINIKGFKVGDSNMGLIFIDISAEFNAALKLKESEKKYKTIIETSHDPIFQITQSGLFFFLSKNWKYLSGYKAKELIGTAIRNLIHSDDVESFESMLHRAQTHSRKINNFEFRLVTKEQRIKYLSCNISHTKGRGGITYFSGIVHDISVQKNALVLHRNNEKYIHTIFDTIPTGILECDIDWNIRLYNKKIRQMTQKTKSQLKNVNILELFDDPQLIKIFPEFKKELLTKKTESIPFFTKILQKSGKQLDIRINWNYNFDSHGNISGFVCILTDISQIKIDQLKILEIEDRFQTITQQSPYAIEIYNVDGFQKSVNPAWEKIWGIKSKDSIGVFNILSDPQVVALPEYGEILDAFRGKTKNFEHLRYTIKDSLGHKIRKHIRSKFYPIKDSVGNIVNIIHVSEDVTKLFQAEMKARSILEGMVDAIYICSLDKNTSGTILETNKAAELQTGYSKSELIGKNIYELLVVDSEYGEKESRKKILYNEKFSRFVEKKHKKDGSEYWTEVILTKLPLGDNDVTVSVNRDITEQLILQETLNQSQKLEALGQLAGGVAHDFNNILTAIFGFTEIGKMVNENNEQNKTLFEEIKASADTAENLVRQLLAFSRKEIISPKIVNIADITRKLEKMLKRMIDDDIVINLNLDDNIDSVYIDPGQIQQIIINLVVNARDAINSKLGEKSEKRIEVGIKNEIISKPVSFSHYTCPVGDYIVLCVRDTGTGIPKKYLKKIFDPFFTTKIEGKGTGLGLATIFGIVERYYGFIKVKSKIDIGTTFEIYFPVYRDGKGKVREKIDEITSKSTGSGKIIFVDDDNVILKYISKALELMGYVIQPFSEPLRALEVLQKTKDIDLLITDLYMPNLNGRDLAKKAKAFNPELNVLFISGYADKPIKEGKDIDTNFAFLAKPFKLGELKQRIEEIIKNDK